jgi:hypothetical protein
MRKRFQITLNQPALTPLRPRPSRAAWPPHCLGSVPPYDRPVNSGQIAFYAAVATAIPVVLVIYIVGAGELAKKRIEHLVDLLGEKTRPRLWTREQARARRRASTNVFARVSTTPVLNELGEFGRLFTVFVLGPAALLALTGVLGFSC